MSHRKHHSREEQAKAEIGHTDSTRGVNWFLTLGFLAAIVAVPLVQNLREIGSIRAGREPGRRVPQCWDVFAFLWPTGAELRDLAGAARTGGLFDRAKAINNRMLRDIQTYEAALKERDAAVQWLIPRMQIAITGWLRGGNEDAYRGRDGWLFYRRDLDYLTGPGFLDPRVLQRRAAGGSELVAAPQPDPVKAIVDFRDQLARRGIDLIVMPAPVKPMIHPERFSARYAGGSAPLQNRSWGEFLARLRAERVAVFDAAPALTQAASGGQPAYLETDTHWTPAAMERVAAALAEFARRQTALPDAPRPKYAAVEKTVTNQGDIANMLRLPPSAGFFSPRRATIRQAVEGAAIWRPRADADVLLLGDSFANIYSLEPMGWGEAAGFAEHLSLALERPLDALTRNDAGSWATRDLLARELRRGRDRLAGKKLVIWEFAARELACGDWKAIDLTLGQPPPATFFCPPPGTTRVAHGTVRELGPVPRPGSVPYKDHIVAIHLVDLRTDDGAVGGGQAVVYAWSMRNNVWTPAARYRSGQEVSLTLRPWSDVSDKLGAINRGELTEDDLAFQEPCWTE
jgi:alginate O-acetyltransferase complex protein AlgJ